MATKKRISKVTTRAGDHGTTKLATGRTVGKHHDIVRAIGSVDELNSHIGVLTSLLNLADADEHHDNTLTTIQQSLFDIGAVIAMEGNYAPPDFGELEETTSTLNDRLSPLTEFVLPGGGASAAQSHVCRSVCRRAETDLWQLINDAQAPQQNLVGAAQYLNRLSDYFFVLARTLNATEETQWQGPKKRG